VSGAWAIVPVKCFAQGKSRLGPSLARAPRHDLARALCDHVLGAITASRAVDGVLVATDCDLVERFATARGALVLRDDTPHPPLAHVVDRALAHVADRATSALILMADLPLLTPDDVRALVAALDRAPLVVAPDRHDAGTNALGLRPPGLVNTCFGSETSFSRHVARARALDLPLTLHRSEGTLFDLDSPADLARAGAYADRGAFFSWNRKRPSRVRAA
jgi:2-phospho-L-lactate guanylyltransferase